MIDAICKEIELRKSEIVEEVETIYFGGGTPSLLSEEEIQQILNKIDASFSVSEKPEITLEANPDDLTESKIKELAKSSINRLSIGIQSFFDEDLKAMNRAHKAQESIDCLSVATCYFENITVDLIYGIPNMSPEKWKQNLQTVFDFGIPHISSYALTVEPKTALDSFIKKGKYPKLDEKLASEHFNILVEESAKHGFVHYETSNFAKEGFFSRHNSSYWKGKNYLGVGPSAHSFNGEQRSWNISNNAKYIKVIQHNELPNEVETLSLSERFNERIMIGLRTIWGISLNAIEQDFGIEYKDQLLENAEKFIDQGFLEIDLYHFKQSEESIISNKIASSQVHRNHEVVKTTQKGKFLADGIASDLFII